MEERQIVPRETYTIANDALAGLRAELTPAEGKIVRLVIAQAERCGEWGAWEYTATSASLAKLIGVSTAFFRKNTGSKYVPTFAHKIAWDLTGLRVELNKTEDCKRGGYATVFSEVVFTEGEWRFVVSHSLSPFVSDLKRLFHAYSFEVVKKLATNRGIRLYELICMHDYLTADDRILEDGTAVQAGEMAFGVEYLRDFFGIGNSYPNTADFLQKLIKGAERDLMAAGISVMHRTVKENHATKWVVFRAKLPDAPKPETKPKRTTKPKPDYGTASYGELDEIRAMIDAIK